MLTMRISEERALSLYKQGKVPGSFYDGCGQEAIGVGAAYALAPEDRMCILHRDLGAHFVRGVAPERYLANYMGRSGGLTGGRDGNMHFGDPDLGCVGMVSMLPDMALVASGMAMAFKLRREPRVAMTFFGEGSTANGQWHEAMNLAGVQRLPVVFMLENNGFAYSTPNDLEFAVDPVERAEGYGFPGVVVDGNDVLACYAAMTTAVRRAQAGEGPTLIEAKTYRFFPHTSDDDDRSYRSREEVEEAKHHDPLHLFEHTLREAGVLEKERVETIGAEIKADVDRQIDEAWNAADPEPETLGRHLYLEADPT
jgi:TPP-dependent pyruvate/acetoin dehydrogenase alpha subunit